MLAGSRDSVPGRRPQTAKPAYRWIVYPTPVAVTENKKASAPSHKGGGMRTRLLPLVSVMKQSTSCKRSGGTFATKKANPAALDFLLVAIEFVFGLCYNNLTA